MILLYPMDQNTKDVLMILIPAASALGTAWVAFKHTQLTGAVVKVADKVEAVAADVLRVETATNGHAKELLDTTKELARKMGKEEGKQEQKEIHQGILDANGAPMESRDQLPEGQTKE